MTDHAPLDAEQLCHRCDPATLGFVTSDTLAPPREAFGQARAIDAIRLAIGMEHPCFNLFVLGEPGSGRHALVGNTQLLYGCCRMAERISQPCTRAIATFWSLEGAEQWLGIARRQACPTPCEDRPVLL